MAIVNSDTMTSGFIYNPHYKTQCVQLNAQAAAVPRGTIICVNGDLPVSASFTGTEAALSGDAENYTPAGTVTLSGASLADGTFDIIGAGSGAYAVPYGVLLNDAPASGSAQSVDVIVFGDLFYAYVNGVYKAANSDNDLTAAQVIALRNIGIFLK